VVADGGGGEAEGGVLGVASGGEVVKMMGRRPELPN